LENKNMNEKTYELVRSFPHALGAVDFVYYKTDSETFPWLRFDAYGPRGYTPLHLAAQAMGRSTMRLRMHVYSGRFSALRIGDVLYISQDSVVEFIANPPKRGRRHKVDA